MLTLGREAILEPAPLPVSMMASVKIKPYWATMFLWVATVFWVAPMTIGAGAYVAAGSTINKAVESDDLAIARVKQDNKKGYAAKPIEI